MFMIMRAAASATLVLASLQFAAAQQPPPVRVRGTIEKVDGNVLTAKARDGKDVTIKLADGVRVVAMVKAQLSDIKDGSFIGVTAMPQPDGSQKAMGIHIFMESQKGVVPARHFGWDREPGSTMTNANVASMATGVEGNTVTVKYPEGEKKVIVPPSTNIVALMPGSRDDLKPGAQFAVVAGQRQADGSIVAPAINVGRNGVAPPM